jgi:PAS domain-containing protein
MSESIHQLERLQAAYEASGDLAYDWNLVDDGMTWLGGNPATLGLHAFDALSNGEAFHQHIHPDDLTARLEALSALYKGRRSFECEFRCRGGSMTAAWRSTAPTAARRGCPAFCARSTASAGRPRGTAILPITTS